MIRNLIFASLAFLISGQIHAVGLIVIDGQLHGATNVGVDGVLYDVEFLDGTCVDLFSGCDEEADFSFDNWYKASRAAQALLDQVFLDSHQGAFDTNSQLTAGCESSRGCFTLVPTSYGIPSQLLNVARAYNKDFESFDSTGLWSTYILNDLSLNSLGPFTERSGNTLTFSRWTPVSPVPGPACDIQLNQSKFSNGDMVTADVFRLANLSNDSVPVELKVWAASSGASATSVLNLGQDGSFVLPAGTDIDLGPLQLLPVDDSLPRGDYEFSCRMLDPVTGELLSEDLNFFNVNARLLHNELANQDIPNTEKYFGVLEAGQYLVTGSIGFGGCPGSLTSPYCIYDVDAISFNIPADLVLDVTIELHIQVTIPPERFSSVTQLEVSWYLNNDVLTWGTESISNPTTKRIDNLEEFTPGGAYYFIYARAPGPFTYAGPSLLENERVAVDYSILLDIHPPQ